MKRFLSGLKSQDIFIGRYDQYPQIVGHSSHDDNILDIIVIWRGTCAASPHSVLALW